MSAREKVAQEIWQRYVVEVGRALPEGLADQMADAAIAAHLEALKADGYAVIKLPEPTAPDFTGVEWTGEAWDVFAYGSTGHRGQVEIQAPRYASPATARELAAALLAAAERAEASR